MRRSVLPLLGLLIAVCGPVWSGFAQSVRPPSEAPASSQPAAEALEPPSLERGAALWAKCRACHTIEADGRNIVGPRLHGVFGRRAGSLPDYRYSEAMKKSGVVWTAESLDGYLAATQDFMPGNKMYGGLAIAQDRNDLIAWLRQQTTR